MHELIAWHSGALYINGWLALALVAGVIAAVAIGKVVAELVE